MAGSTAVDFGRFLYNEAIDVICGMRVEPIELKKDGGFVYGSFYPVVPANDRKLCGLYPNEPDYGKYHTAVKCLYQACG